MDFAESRATSKAETRIGPRPAAPFARLLAVRRHGPFTVDEIDGMKTGVQSGVGVPSSRPKIRLRNGPRSFMSTNCMVGLHSRLPVGAPGARTAGAALAVARDGAAERHTKLSSKASDV